MSADGRRSVAGIVLAAGGSRRFGSPKQTAPFRGRPLIEHALATLATAPSLDRRFVVLGARRAEVIAGADLSSAEQVVCETWRTGQAASLAAGIAAAAGAGSGAAVVVLADQPLISSEAIERVVGAHRADPGVDAARALYAGRPGHPVLISSSLFAAVQELSGDLGARELLDRAQVREVPCDGLGAPADIDTQEALLALEAELGRATS